MSFSYVFSLLSICIPRSFHPLLHRPKDHQPHSLPPASPLQASSGDVTHSSESSSASDEIHVIVDVSSSPELSGEDEIEPEGDEKEHVPQEPVEEHPEDQEGDLIMRIQTCLMFVVTQERRATLFFWVVGPLFLLACVVQLVYGDILFAYCMRI